jgi:cell division protein FtsB
MTDEHEHAMKVAEQAYSAGNLVTCDGYYEFDLDAAAAVIAADRAGLVARIAELKSEVEVLADNGCHLDALCKQQEAENARLRETGAFLLGRLDELEWHDGQLDETARQYFGHVGPAVYRFRAALGARNDADA